MNASILTSVYGLFLNTQSIDNLRMAMFGEDTRGMVEAYKAVFLKFPYDLRLEHEVNFQTLFSLIPWLPGFLLKRKRGQIMAGLI